MNSSISPTMIAPSGFTVALINSDSKERVMRDAITDNGFQHLVAIKESTRKNLQDIQNSLSNNMTTRKKVVGTSYTVLSEPLL